MLLVICVVGVVVVSYCVSLSFAIFVKPRVVVAFVLLSLLLLTESQESQVNSSTSFVVFVVVVVVVVGLRS